MEDMRDDIYTINHPLSQTITEPAYEPFHEPSSKKNAAKTKTIRSRYLIQISVVRNWILPVTSFVPYASL
jgi:hypothetical protein